MVKTVDQFTATALCSDTLADNETLIYRDPICRSLAVMPAAIDITYYLLCAVLVFFMQVGFAMLEVGCVSAKNINNIILKGVLDITISAMTFWAFGYALAYGGDNGEFIGGDEYFFGKCLDGSCAGYDSTYHGWFFQFAFAATAATIVSGAVAERTTITAYVLYSVVLTGFVYPVVVHWQWGGGYTSDEGAVDYAGSGVVHMTGGLAGIIGAAIIGPREGRFAGPIFKVTANPMPAYSVVFQTLGVCILWFGWYGFNTGSTLGIHWVAASEGKGASEAGLVMMNTTLAPAAAALTAMFIKATVSFMKGDGFKIYLTPVLNGILAGLVSITAGCGDVRPWAAVVMGMVGGAIYMATSALQVQLKIDDVVDAGPVHFWCGIWGVFALGLFADDEGTGLSDKGAFYGDGTLLEKNCLLIVLIILWVGATSVFLFGTLRFLGVARVSAEVESMGLDRSEHGVDDGSGNKVNPGAASGL